MASQQQHLQFDNERHTATSVQAAASAQLVPTVQMRCIPQTVACQHEVLAINLVNSLRKFGVALRWDFGVLK